MSKNFPTYTHWISKINLKISMSQISNERYDEMIRDDHQNYDTQVQCEDQFDVHNSQILSSYVSFEIRPTYLSLISLSHSWINLTILSTLILILGIGKKVQQKDDLRRAKSKQRKSKPWLQKGCLYQFTLRKGLDYRQLQQVSKSQHLETEQVN